MQKPRPEPIDMQNSSAVASSRSCPVNAGNAKEAQDVTSLSCLVPGLRDPAIVGGLLSH